MTESLAGEHINDYIKRAMAEAPVECEFNGTKFTVTPDDTSRSAYAKWETQRDADSEVYRKSPEGKAAAQRQREYEKREQEKRERVAAMELKPMTVKPELADEYAEYVKLNSSDGYSKGVVDFGERWAALMEIGISQLNDRSDAALTRYFVDHASDLSGEANTEGITGYMYGAAASALAHFWIHGEPLRRWHNKDTQIGDEGEWANESGGVLNPALLTIGSPE